MPIFLRFIIWELRKSLKESFQGIESQWSEIELADNKLVSVGQCDDLEQVFQFYIKCLRLLQMSYSIFVKRIS